MILKKSLWSWALTRCRGLQALLLLLIVFTVFFRVFPLEMQKRIINEAVRFRKIHTLFVYCGLYMGAVLLAGLLKYAINVLQGYIGQKILVEMRTGLYRHILQLPIGFYRRTQPGMVISSLTAEISSVADFLGSAVAVPLVNVLTLATFGAYMFYLNPLLAVLSLAIYPFEIAIIPFLQKRFNRLNSERVTVTRAMSNAVGEAVSGIHEIHANASYDLENEKVARFSRNLLQLRHRMNLYKFGIKFTNNFFQSLGPFLLFLIGGYLSIQGRFSLGALVAFLSAYEKLYDPWKELMDFYQDYQNASVSYRRIQEAFDVQPEFRISAPEPKPVHISGHVRVEDLSFEVDGHIRLLEQINVELKPGQRLALVGLSGSGKSTLAMIMAQLYRYDYGHVYLDQYELKELAKAELTPHLGFVAQYPFIFDGSIRENILYGFRAMAAFDGGTSEPVEPAPGEVLDIVERVGLTEDVLRFGLNTVLGRECCEELTAKVLRARRLLHQAWGSQLGDSVEFFQEGTFLDYSSIATNIVFGYPVREGRPCEILPKSPRFRAFLEESGLWEPLLALGLDVARRTVPLLSDLRDDPFFFQQSPIPADELDLYRDILEHYRSPSVPIHPRDTEPLLALALRTIPGKHKMVVVPQALRSKILEARPLFRDYCSQKDPDAFIYYSENEYLYSRTLLENLLFGRLKEEASWVWDKVMEAVLEILRKENLYDHVLHLGLEFQVGSKGDRLSGGQKQKVGIARALLKKPRVLILDEATASLDMASQHRIQHYLDVELRGKTTIISVAHRLETIRDYDLIAVMKSGQIVEIGGYEELLERKGLFYELVRGHQ
jgi:putative ABC transport system ATP-binding protein